MKYKKRRNFSKLLNETTEYTTDSYKFMSIDDVDFAACVRWSPQIRKAIWSHSPPHKEEKDVDFRLFFYVNGFQRTWMDFPNVTFKKYANILSISSIYTHYLTFG